MSSVFVAIYESSILASKVDGLIVIGGAKSRKQMLPPNSTEVPVTHRLLIQYQVLHTQLTYLVHLSAAA